MNIISRFHLVALLSLLYCNYALAQYSPSYTIGYDPNFIGINKSNFSPTQGTTSWDNNQKLTSTVLNLTMKIFINLMSINGSTLPISNIPTTLPELNNTNAYSYNKIVRANGIIARKVVYAKNHVSGNPDQYVRMLIVRPDDNIQRPCIIITNGAQSLHNFKSSATSGLYASLVDFALRGYSVVFYESCSNDLIYIAKEITPASYPCNYSANLGIASNVEKNGYANFQYGVAAYNYILNDASLPIGNRLINANTNEIHAYGISMGAVTALMLAYSRNNINYVDNTNSTTDMQDFYIRNGTECETTKISNNNFTKVCLQANPTPTISLKSVCAGDGGLPSNGGDFFTTINGTQPKNLPTLLLFGRNDNIVYYDAQSFLDLPVISFDSIRRTLKSPSLNRPNKLIVNCTGDHGFGQNAGGIELTMNASPNDFIILNNTQQVNSTQYTGFIEYKNTNDFESTYNSFTLDGIAFRKFTTQLGYNIIQTSNINTIISSFYKDARTNSLSTYYNNNPIYIKTALPYSCTQFWTFPTRCLPANVDGHLENSTTCSIPTYKIRSNTVFLRTSKPDNTNIQAIMKDEFLVYPNPTNNELNIDYASYNEKNIAIKIYSTIGEVLFTLNKTVSLGNNKIQINTGELPNGIYIMTIENNAEIFTSNIIISK